MKDKASDMDYAKAKSELIEAVAEGADISKAAAEKAAAEQAAAEQAAAEQAAAEKALESVKEKQQDMKNF